MGISHLNCWQNPTPAQQKIIRGIEKNRYHLKIRDAAKFLHSDGLVPGYREIPFHIDDEIMAAVRDHMKERLAVREREQQEVVEEAGEDSSED